MGTGDEEDEDDEAPLSREAAANLLYAESVYRHGVFWSTAYRWATIAVLVMYVPWLNSDLRDQLGVWAVIFPILGLIAAVLGAVLVLNDLARFDVVRRMYGQVRGERYMPRWEFSSRQLQWIADRRMVRGGSLGWLVVLAFPILLVPLGVIDIVALVLIAD